MEKINYTLTLDDCTNYARSQIKIPRFKKYLLNNIFKRYFIYILFLALGSLILFGISIFQICNKYHLTFIQITTNKGFPHFLLSQFKFYFITLIIFSAIFLVILITQYYFKSGKAIYKMQEGTDLNFEVSISKENITRINKNSTLIINWETIKDLYDTKHHYLIFISDRQAVIIPKRIFENEEQGKEFYNLIQSYYNEAK